MALKDILAVYIDKTDEHLLSLQWHISSLKICSPPIIWAGRDPSLGIAQLNQVCSYESFLEATTEAVEAEIFETHPNQFTQQVQVSPLQKVRANRLSDKEK